MKQSLFYLLASLLIAPLPAVATETIVEADVCAYGGTSGGVVAAVQPARMGKRAVIVEPGGHLGGMTAGASAPSISATRGRLAALLASISRGW